MENIFLEVTIVILLASLLSIGFRFLKQPPILAYILAGVLIGPLALFKVNNQEVLQVMAEFGITLLLFMLGLELKISDLKSVGKISLITGIGQILFTSAIGYVISLTLGFSSIASLYISIALTFSSTIIIVKLLSDKKDLNSLYGKISIGFLLVQDFFAILALIMLSGFNTSDGTALSFLSFVQVIIKGAILFAAIIFLSKKILPRMLNKISYSSETLFLFSIAWAFGMAALVSSPRVGFSIEIGGFLAGLALANSNESFQIVSKIKSLRDFFITIFFVILGTKMVFAGFSDIWFPAIVFSLFILIGNPLIVMVIMGLLGFRRRTSFLAGLTVAQISEFSLIVIFMGSKLGHVSTEIVSLVTVVGVITFTFSTYMILNGNKLYKILNPYLRIFERKTVKEKILDLGELKDHIVLIGANRTAQTLINEIKNLDDKVIVVDFNPDVIEDLKEKNLSVLFGDISDLDIQEKVQLEKAKLVISTVPDIEDNLILIERMNYVNKFSKIIVVAQDRQDAKALYKAGADYVVLPHLAGSRQIAKILKEDSYQNIKDLKEKDLSYL